jgi:octaprenyl-diphosphate synthase
MTLSSALPLLEDSAAGGRGGALPAARVAEVRALVAGELARIEELVRERIARGVAPGAEAAKHLVDAGGKRVRPLGLLLAAACFGPLSGRARDLAAAAELVHMATLLHDDVIDDGDQRRGRPTSRRIWGNAVSVLAGDLLLVEALRLASADANDDATWTELVATLGRLVDGEIVQLRGRVEVSLDETTYFEIVRGKTASLFEWALRAGARAGGAPADAIDALGRVGGSLGIAFQLVDDLLDYDGDGAQIGKSLLADLAEGKVTLPLIVASRTKGVDVAELVARVREGDAASADALAVRVRTSGACADVRRLALHETHRALAELDALAESPAREALADVARALAARVS